MRRLANTALAEGDGKEYRALVNAATRARRSHDTALAGLGLRGSERGVSRREGCGAILRPASEQLVGRPAAEIPK